VLADIRNLEMDSIDTLIMAAGIRKTNQKAFVPGQSLEMLVEATRSLNWDDLEKSFRVNVYSQYYLTAGLLDLIGASAAKQSGRGSIICFSSVASKHTAQFVPAYQTSKAAVDHMVKIMAAEFADHYSEFIYLERSSRMFNSRTDKYASSQSERYIPRAVSQQYESDRSGSSGI
jgi:NAD(P)-dependent dehydrogenase (short-subunit alcohol dehydrogenase family)